MGIIEYNIKAKDKKFHIVEKYIYRIEETLISGYDYNSGEKVFQSFNRDDLHNYLENTEL